LPKEFCSIRSRLVAELTAATNRVTKTVDQLKVAKDREEIIELGNRRNQGIVKCGRLLQKLGNHRAEHDC